MAVTTPPGTAVATAPPTAQRAALFGLLADPLRLQIVELLAAEQQCTCHLIEQTGAKQTTISHHLRILREGGAVDTEQVGRFTWYRLRPEVLHLLADSLTGLTSQAQHAGRNRLTCP
jgi:ArsR family transcriptional regulator